MNSCLLHFCGGEGSKDTEDSGTYGEALVYSDPVPGKCNQLACWVDSDYVCYPDARDLKSETSYVLSMTTGTILGTRKDCVTLSSAKAEYVAAARKSLVRVMHRDLDYEQEATTMVGGDNTTCIQIANNLVSRKLTRHIDVGRCYVWQGTAS